MGYNASIFLLMPKTVWDPDALAFILAHNTATGSSMGIVQKTAINNLYKRFKGTIVNPNGSNLWSILSGTASRIWVYCPVSDSVADSNGYKIEFFTKTSLGTFTNFVSGDFTVNGVIGGATKYFNSGFTMAALPTNTCCVGVYNRTNATSTSYVVGVADASSSVGLITRNLVATKLGYALNRNIAVTNINTANSLGLLMIDRSSSTSTNFYKSGTSISSESSVSVAPAGTQNLSFHAYNNAGVITNNTTNQLCVLLALSSTLTANQHSDLYWIIQNYNTEVITGGRQV